jgi:predicted TIM-barrel fold metal-dependent hydrolase
MQIETGTYIETSANLNNAEILIKEEYLPLLPDRIVDVHSHLGTREAAETLSSSLLQNMVTTYPYFSEEEHARFHQILWEERHKLTQVVFGFPFLGIDVKKSNDYVLEVTKSNPMYVPFLMGDPNNLSYTQTQIRSGNWFGVKMYAEQLKLRASRIVDFYPESILEVINEQKLPIILHLPNNLVTDSAELVQLSDKFRDVRFIVAHFGLSRGPLDQTKEALRAVEPFANILFDTSWYIGEDELKAGFEILGGDKIMYASDQPFNLIRARFVQHPQFGERILTDQPYHWANSVEQNYYKEVTGMNPSEFANFHYEGIRVLLNAITRVYKREDLGNAIDKVFYKNAAKLLKLS